MSRRRHARLPDDTFERVVDLENLYDAWRRTRRGKRRSPAALAFELDADRHLVRIRKRLGGGAWRPAPLQVRVIRDPKIRPIVIARFADRVVHQALFGVLGDFYERSFIDHTYACRVGRGTHRAALRYLSCTRRFGYRLSLDVRRYFPTVDHTVLKGLLLRPVRDRRLEDLLVRLVDAARGLYTQPHLRALLAGDPAPRADAGLPIGTLFSQQCANLYLSAADHFVTRVLRPGAYQRYMDDLTLFDDDPERLRDAEPALADWLLAHRRLHLHPSAGVRRAKEPSSYLGFDWDGRTLRPGRTVRRNLARKVAEGDPERLEAVLLAYRSWAEF